jgi:PleD family two-component response regulator
LDSSLFLHHYVDGSGGSIRQGADDYVVKPLHSLELTARIKAILQR